MRLKDKMELRSFGVLLVVVGIGLSACADETLTNALVALTLDGKGVLTSLRETGSGRELVRTPGAFVSVVDAAGKSQVPTSLARDAGGRLVFAVAGGEVALAAHPFDGGWTFEVVRASLDGAQELHVGSVQPTCRLYEGRMANACSDEQSFVCVRAYDAGASFYCHAGKVEAYVKAKSRPFAAARFGFAAGPRPSAIPALRAMTVAAGVPHSDKGGAWALGAPDNRRSYWMAWGVGAFTADDEIELCRRGGFKTLHFDRFFDTYGNYSLRKKDYPNGMEDLKAVLEKAHAADLFTDFHSLTACVSRKDPWVTPECRDGLMATASYTLARPLAASTNDDTVVVNEKPVAGHEIVDSGFGNANFLKIDTEIVQYTGMSERAPWTFTGVKRGACGTTVKPHRTGAKVNYLRNSFSCFQVDADSELAKESWAIQGRLFGAGFDSVYLDGADCIHVDPRKCDKFVRGIYSAALANGKAPQFEDSLWTAAAWWFHSRIGANDHVHWDSKRSLDRRFARTIPNARKANFLEPEMGWWSTVQSLYAAATPYRIDEHEYFGVRCAAADAAMSVLPDLVYSARYQHPFNIHRSLTVLGWYERFRYARAFADEAIADFNLPRAEYRLRQDADGVWRYRPVRFDRHRVGSADQRAWTLPSDEPRPAMIRVEALQKCCAFDAKESERLVDPEADAFETEAAKGVTVSFAKERDAAHGATVRISAANADAPRRGAWSRVSRTWPRNAWADVSKKQAVGVWVKGDGSGALLNVQLEAPKVFSRGLAEHYVRLDFTGWKYFEFNRRERDSDQFHDYAWPYDNPDSGILYTVERTGVNRLHAVNFYLTDIPAGGRAEAEIGEVRTLTETKGLVYRDLAVTLNGERLPLPFELKVFEFAELEDGRWTRFNASGDPLERRPGPAAAFRFGTNTLAFEGRSNAADGAVRCEVNTLAFGERRPALKAELSGETAKELAYEAMEPERWAPAKGFTELQDVVTRPGEKARVAFEVYGPIAPFTLAVGGDARRFDVALAENQYLVCRDCEHWQVRERGENPRVVAEGRIEPFRAVAGRAAVTLSCDAPEKAFARVEMAKHYFTGVGADAWAVPARHRPKAFMGRDFWRALYKYGDWACWAEWTSPARIVRFDNPELYRHPAFEDVVWSYFGRTPAPDLSTGKAVWRNLGENFLDKEPDKEILSSNPDPTRPFFLSTTGKRGVNSWAGEIDLDRAEYDRFLKDHPNLVYDGSYGEWCSDLLLAYPKLRKMTDPVRRAQLEAVIGKEPPSDRYALTKMLKRYFDARRRGFYDGRIRVGDAHLNSFHTAMDCGAHMFSLETTDSSGNGTTADEKAYFRESFEPTGDEEDAKDDSGYRWNVSAMFARGAARQFRTIWEWYIAGYTNGWTEDGKWWNNTVTVYPESDAAPDHYEKISWNCGPEWGQSASNLRRAHYFAYLNGCTFVNMEEWSAQFTMWDRKLKKTVFSPRAKLYLDFADFTRTHPDRGAVYAPVAICVPVDQGYPTWGGYPWGLKRCGYTRGDAAVDAVFYTLVPGFERAKEHRRGVEYNLINSPFAQMYDVIAPDAKRLSAAEMLGVFRSYRAIVVVGDYPNRDFETTLAQYEAEGGRVVRLGEKEVPPVAEGQINDVKGGRIRFPEVEKAFAALQRDHFPLTVGGDVCYGLNRTSKGWWLWMFNSKGVIKFADKPERIDHSFDSRVSVRMPSGFGSQVSEITCGAALDRTADGFSATVPAGDLRIFEIK